MNGAPAGASERVYKTPCEEFELSSINLESGAQYVGNAPQGPDTIIVMNGAATLISNGQSTPLARGTIIFVPLERTVRSTQVATPQCCSKRPFLHESYDRLENRDPGGLTGCANQYRQMRLC